jgi:hypothetical protein
MALVYAAEIPGILRQSVNNPEKRVNVDEIKGVSLCLMHGGGLHPELPGGKGLVLSRRGRAFRCRA